MTRQIIEIPANSALFSTSRETFSQYGYSPAVRGGGLLFISGQIGMKADGTIPQDVAEQSELAFERTIEILRWVGLTSNDLVELYSYHVDMPNSFSQFTSVKDRYITGPFPAWTAVGVAALGLSDMKIELRSVAAFRE